MAKTASKEPSTKKTGKVNKQVNSGRVYVTATFNNTLVTVTDSGGNTLFQGSAGGAGFKGARKSTPFAATTAVEQVGKRAWENGMRELEVYIKGPGAGRDAALRALKTLGFNINLIADVTPVPHNGPRPKKKRRV